MHGGHFFTCIQYIEHNMEHMGGPWGTAGHRIVSCDENGYD